MLCKYGKLTKEYISLYKTGKKAKANSKIVTFASGAYLVATRSIVLPRYDEILTPYGVKYKMISMK